MINTQKISTYNLLLIAWLFLCLLGGLETLMVFLFKPEVIQSSKVYWFPIMRVLNGYAAITLVLYPGYKWLRSKSILNQILGYLFVLILFVLVYLIFSVGQFQLIFMGINFELFVAGVFETMMTDLHHIAAYYFFLLFICASKGYYDEKTTAIIKREQLEKELTETKFTVLQRQLQPHFLFNTLNSAITIMDEKKKSAQEMLLDLSELLRNSLETDFGKLIPLKKEIEILENYLSIEKKRFEYQLNYRIEVQKNLEKVKVLPFLFQPLAENAIKHGYKGEVGILNLEIDVAINDGRIIIKVSNDGAPLKNYNNGIGLQNLKERLENTYGDTYYFSLHQENERVINTIEFPSK